MVEDQTSITVYTLKMMGEYFRQMKSSRLWWVGNVARNAREEKDINVARNVGDEKNINIFVAKILETNKLKGLEKLRLDEITMRFREVFNEERRN